MSSSTIVIKTPTPSHPDGIDNKIKYNEPKSSSLLIVSLWFFASMFSATKMNFTSNMAGISVSFNIQDVAIITFAAWLLHKGLSKVQRIVMFILPLIVITLYGLYYNHYKGIVKMATVLKHFKHMTVLPWIALLLASFGLVIRIILILRVLQVTANLWYRKKLEKELYETLG